MTLPFALLAALALSASPTKANAVPAGTGTKLEQGQRAFAEGQLDVALKLLDAAAAENPDPATVEKVQLLRGQCLAARQDFGKAEEAFALALDANPEASLDPGKVDPSVVKLLESMRARLSGVLEVRATPVGAQVLIDGVDVGTAPLTQSTGIGRHKVSAKWAEASTETVEVLVRSKRQTLIQWVEVKTEKQVFVEKVVEVPAPPPPEPAPSKVHFFGDVRGVLEVNAGPEGNFDLGVGIDVPQWYLRVQVSARLFPYFHVIPRVAFVMPLGIENLSVLVEAELPLRLATNLFGAAFGGSAGVEWAPVKLFAVYGQVGGTYYWVNPNFVVDTRFTTTLGIRVRTP